MKLRRLLYRDQVEKDELEARNARLQFRRILELIPISSTAPKVLRLTPETITELHRAAMEGIYSCAGHFRDWGVHIIGSPHVPPEGRSVQGLVEDMCEKVNENENEWDPVETAAFLLWKIAWIHPFGGGNGRTSRAVAHLALCVRLGFIIPGTPTLAERIVDNRSRYIEALRDADRAWENGVVDIRMMTVLLNSILEQQLANIASRTSPPGAGPPDTQPGS